jgi:outer membrane protein assembly complex protein YaeT
MNLVRSLLAYVPCVVVCLAVARPLALLAQYQKYDGKEVLTIQFDPVVQPVDPSELYEILPLKIHQPLTMAGVRASIERLFATGRYADIQVDAEPYQNGVIVRFLTKNSWFIGNVSAVGSLSNPNPGQLENATRLELGQPYTDAKLREAVAGQQRLLESNGLYLSGIHPVLDYDRAHQQVNLRFEIDAGRRAHFAPPVPAGDLKMDPGKIVSATKFRRWIIHTWKPVTQTRVVEGIKGIRTLYQDQNRLEAKVALDSLKYDPGTNSALPTLRIDAGPRIEVRTTGAKVPQRKLRRLVPVFEEHAVDHDLLVEGARNLRDYFQSSGYFDAEVEFKEQGVVNDKSSIDYVVSTGKRHRLVAIEIRGNRYFDAETIRERLFLQKASFLQFPHGRYSESLLGRDEDSIVNLYQSNGFRDVRLTHRLEDNYRGKAGDMAVSLTIDEGPQYFVNHLEVEGIRRLDQAHILTMLNSTEDQPFSEFNVAVDRDTILAQYFDNGFPNATFEWSSKPAGKPHLMDLRFTVSEGDEKSVREVLINQGALKTTRPSLVYRNLHLNPGDPLSPTAITETQRRLYDLGVFSRVETAIQNPDGESSRKYVLYEMEEARRYSFAAGLGAQLTRIGGCQTCLDAPAGQTGFSPRVSLDFTRSNLWGLAHSISLRTRVSTLERRGLLTYTWPRFRNQERFNVSFTGLYEDSNDIRTFSYKREEGSAQLSQRISKATTLFYRYTYRRVGIDQATLKITPFLIPLLSQPVRLGLISGGFIQDRRDDPVDPHKGIYNTLDVGLAEHVVGSQRNFLRFLARNATYHPIGKKLVLARSTEFGDIYAFRYAGNVLDAIPLPERFFGGGGTSQRGFPENQAGPRDPVTGFPLGGTAVLFNQVELRFPLVGDNISGVLFHDAGNAYSSLGNLSFRVKQRNLQDFDYMVHAVGFGIRYRTPVGPIRVDLAYSINPPRFFGFKGSLQDLVNAGVNPCAAAPGVASKCVAQGVSHFQYFFSIGQTF